MNNETTSVAEITEPSLNANVSLPSSYISKRYGDYLAEEGKLYFFKENPKGSSKEFQIYIGELTSVKECCETIETGAIQLILEYWYKGRQKEVTISREQLQKREFVKLMGAGVDAAESKVNHVLCFLDKQEKEDAPLTYIHKGLGWGKYNNQFIFKHHNILGSSEVESTYKGQFNIQPKGTFEAWQTIVEKHILGHTSLEFALVFGFSATLNAYFSEFTSMDTLVVHIFGDSSTGKTTATRVATSSFGKPTTTDNGLVLTWNSTANALLNQLKGVRGIPIGLDEASMNGMKDFSRMIYQLAGGEEMRRLNADIELREKGTWSGGFISNAEHSLQHKSNQNTGLKVRLPEYGNVRWTKSAEHADVVNRGFEQNYGHAGPMFVEYLLKQDQEQLMQRLKVHENELLDVMTEQDQFTNRLASKFSTLLLTATLMNELFSFQVDVDAIRDFIVEHEQGQVEDRDIGKRAIAALVPQIIEYYAYFDARNVERKTSQCYGSIQEKSAYTEVAILKHKFEEWLSEAGFSDSSVVLRAFKDCEVLDCEAGKNTRKRKLPDGSEQNVVSTQSVYVLKLEKHSLSNHTQPVEVSRTSGRRPVQSVKSNAAAADIFKPTSEIK
ncbi:DUF927 domain-containing protein [Sporosarcina sp. FSL K6-5500]|uniref:DUF927 domain-containing protein n=1 Tax=Sporosarcina sp. FSL K6-5500 TaxID=2921558 RepID=UPI0030FA39C9